MAIEAVISEIEGLGLNTEKGLLVLIGLALALEVYALLNSREKDTISEVVWGLRNNQPWAVFLAGFLAGHLFW